MVLELLHVLEPSEELKLLVPKLHPRLMKSRPEGCFYSRKKCQRQTSSWLTGCREWQTAVKDDKKHPDFQGERLGKAWYPAAFLSEFTEPPKCTFGCCISSQNPHFFHCPVARREGTLLGRVLTEIWNSELKNRFPQHAETLISNSCIKYFTLYCRISSAVLGRSVYVDMYSTCVLCKYCRS